MNKTTKWLTLTLLAALTAVSQQAWGQTTLFESKNVSGQSVYRIPSIVRLPNGNLWALCDQRHDNNGLDLGNNHRIDVVGKLSTDNGSSWGSQQDIAMGTASSGYDYAHGDPASVVDRETGRILVVSASGTTGWPSKIQTARSVTDDNGNWSISEITDKVYQSGGETTCLFFSSGRMIQSTLVKNGTCYRIYAALDTYTGGSRVAYSDDFGLTWTYLGGVSAKPYSAGDECKVEELPNGNILLSCRVRNYAGRYFNIFTFTDKTKATGSWGTAVSGNITAASCNGELLLVPAKRASDGKQVYVLLQSAAMSSDRNNVGIYWKELSDESSYDSPSDFSSNWNAFSISSTSSCYSTMVLDKNGDIAFLYEEDLNTKNSAYNIKFQTFSLATITSNAYSYSPNTASDGYHTTSEPTELTTLATPTFSPDASTTYTTAQQVTISSTDDNVTIYYTTDGTTPTASSTKYTGAITVNQTTTLKAIAIDANGKKSSVATATYTVQVPDGPTFSVAAGTYAAAQTVELKAADGATIYYTTDGTEPTTSSTKYTSAITVSQTMTLKAIAVDAQGNLSKVATASYSIVSTDKSTKMGVTISMDNGSSTQLFSSNASGSSKDTQYFGFLRHNIAHVQIITSNASTLSTNGDGLFLSNDNDMLFKTIDDAKYLSFCTSSSVKSVYAQVVAPKGYRIIRYQMTFDTTNSTDGSTVTQYTYDADGNVVDGTSVATADGSWDQTLANGTNMLYFRFDATTSAAVVLKSLQLTYVIDQPISAQLPNDDGELNMHTGLLDPGTFSHNGNSKYNFWTFNRSNITDTQDVSLVNGKGEAQTETYKVDDEQYFVLAANGDYFIEAPQKFRIVGADLKFLRQETSGDGYNDVTTMAAGDYIITDGTHYLNLSGSSITNGSSADDATVWTVSQASNGTAWNIKSGDYYLVLTSTTTQSGGQGGGRPGGGGQSSTTTYGVGTSTTLSNANWIWDSDNHCFKGSSTTSSPHYIAYTTTTSGWGPNQTTTSQWGISESSHAKAQQKQATTTDFTATVYNRDNSAAATNGTAQLTESNASATVTVADYNNDAIRFNISGLATGAKALYNVNLKILPLNPEVQTLQVAAKTTNGEVGTNEVTPVNYTFHNGEAVSVLVPKNATSPYQIVFRKAENEEKTLWYTQGVNNNNIASTGGYSNYFIVGSDAYNTAGELDANATPYPDARVDADMAGTKELKATNIDAVYNETASTLQDNVFNVGDGGLEEVKLTDGTEQKVFVYAADMPTWNIMPDSITTKKKHIDYRFYTITVKPVVENETAVVDVKTIYTKTLKGAPEKTGSSIDADKNALDESHTYVGVTVTSKADNNGTAYGVLTNTEIISAIKEKMKDMNYCGFSESDPYRGILYVDMSGLTTVSGEKTTEGEDNWDAFHKGTADNCLYFMPTGFNRVVNNTIAKKNGGYEAVGDIVLKDQQPFYTPYDFTTGTRKASYTRESTTTKDGTTKATVQNMTAVLPFSMTLDGEGHLKTANDATDKTVTFHNITGYGKVTAVSAQSGQDITYAMLAEAITDGKAEANKPYYVTSDTPGFEFNIVGAQFAKTPEAATTTTDGITESLERTSGSWTAHGTYAGVQPAAGSTGGVGTWYFSKDLFWNAAKLTTSDHVNVRPFRSYYKTTDTTPATQNEAKASVVFDLADITPTGISDIDATEGDLTVSADHGTLTLTANAATRYATYTVGGQLVARGLLTKGASRTLQVPAGVYLVNNVKVVVK